MRIVLRRPGFRLLFAALLAGLAAESLLLFALAIWVKDLTGSNGLAGATLFAIIGPMVLAPLVGWVVDRFRRRPFFVVVNLLTGALLTPLLAVDDRGDIWIVYTVGALYGLATVASAATLSGLLRELVPVALLAEANGALQAARHGFRLVGPLVGAAIYTSIGGGALTGVAVAGFVVAAVVTGRIRLVESAPARTPGRRWFAELGGGLRHLTGEVALRRAVLGYGCACLVTGFSESLIFAYVDQGLGREPGFVGVLIAVQGAGGLLGALFAASVVRRVGEIGTLAVGVGSFGLAALALAYPNLAVAVAAMLLAGLALSLAAVGLHTLVQLRTPAGLLGRVTAATRALTSAPQAISIAAGAVLVGVLDHRLLFVLVGVATLAAAGYLWTGRRLCPSTRVSIPGQRRPLPGGAHTRGAGGTRGRAVVGAEHGRRPTGRQRTGPRSGRPEVGAGGPTG